MLDEARQRTKKITEIEKTREKQVEKTKQQLEEERLQMKQKREERMLEYRNNIEKAKIRDHMKNIHIISNFMKFKAYR